MAKKARNRRSGREERRQEQLRKMQAHADSGTATEDELRQLAGVVADAAGDEEGLEVGEDAALRANLAAEAGGDGQGGGGAADAAGDGGEGSSLVRYLKGVNLEMRRVTWPTPTELAGYSVRSIALLIATGAAVWAIDNALIAAIIAFSSLRG